jgi:pyruvate formate lyase activating enzyme
MVSKNEFQIGGLQKLTLLDYPGKVSAMVFTIGCNMRCPFCHNYELVKDADKIKDLVDPQEVIDYLKKRKGVLDGLVITGGEPTLQRGLKDFIKEVKEETGLLVKLDSNGLNPTILKELIDEKLVDYVAMDIKNDFENYGTITGIANLPTNRIQESINILEESDIEYEFRTTVIKDFHTLDRLKNIVNFIKKDSNYFLQQFIISENVPNKNLKYYTDEELINIGKELKEIHPNIKVRGIRISNE